jgi:DNA recombination protein RmuC
MSTIGFEIAAAAAVLVLLVVGLLIGKLISALAALREAKSGVEQQNASRVSGLEEKLESARGEIRELTAQNARLNQALEHTREQANDKRELVEGLTTEFKVLAQEATNQYGESLKKQTLEQLTTTLEPFRENLGELRQSLQSAQTETAKERATLLDRIGSLTQTSARMSTETENLTNALKGNTRMQGAWGEVILKKVLEQSGLREGEDYTLQESYTTENGNRLRPDCVLNLPGNQRIIIDSKVSLTAYTDYFKAQTDAERESYMKQHVASVRSHIGKLSEKEYQDLTDSEFDFVLMFLPIEGSLTAALDNDRTLIGFAADKRVAIVTPTTLLLALKWVAMQCQTERRNRYADEIARRAGKLYDKFVGFVEAMGEIGELLDRAQESHATAMDRLSKGRGNLVWQTEQLKEMGAKTAKSISQKLLDLGEQSDEAAAARNGESVTMTAV